MGHRATFRTETDRLRLYKRQRARVYADTRDLDVCIAATRALIDGCLDAWLDENTGGT